MEESVMRRTLSEKITIAAFILLMLSISFLSAGCGKSSVSSSSNKKTAEVKTNTEDNTSTSSTSSSGSISSEDTSLNKSSTSNSKNTKTQSSSVSSSDAISGIASDIPNGFQVLEKVKGTPEVAIGDLNNDGINDVAAVLEVKSNPKSGSRGLLIAFGNKNKSYDLKIIAKNAVLNADEGGVWGDPFESISVNRGSVLLNFYAGSNDRWYSSYRFRYQNNGFYLIGATTGSYYNPTTKRENADQEDYNLLTGDYEIRKADQNGKLVTTKGNRGKKALVNIMNFVANSENKQY